MYRAPAFVYTAIGQTPIAVLNTLTITVESKIVVDRLWGGVIHVSGLDNIDSAESVVQLYSDMLSVRASVRANSHPGVPCTFDVLSNRVILTCMVGLLPQVSFII